MKTSTRIMIAGTGSGCGKTTFTCALMAALARRGLAVQPFKCGPDYIDPMFHTHITGRPSGNLDGFLLPAPTLRHLMKKNAKGADCSVIEGVMGFYDGQGTTCTASSYEVASITKTPVLLLLNARGMSSSLAATAKGFVTFRPENGIAGLLLNGVGERQYASLKPMLEEETGLEILGHLPRMEDCSLESRHLGLVTALETEGLDAKVARLATQAERSIDLNRILEIASSAPYLLPEPSPLDTTGYEPQPFRLAIARDAAFCFYYHDALALLEELGAELVPFSPLDDAHLPDADGLYLGGGYPELNASRLSSNVTLLDDMRRRVLGGLPTFAECGGFMALCRELRTDKGVFRMSGVFEGAAFMTEQLVRFGYVALKATRDGLLAPKGWEGRGHEFHYSDSTDNGDGFEIAKPDGRRWAGIHTRLSENENTKPTLHAGYAHLHLCGDPRLAVNFARACVGYRRERDRR